jgi:tcmP protein
LSFENKDKMETKQLTSIPETMLIPLWAKATEYNHPRPILSDPFAAEMIGQVDYDFTKFKGAKMSQVGVCVRAKLIDDETKEFLAQHPDAVVIQLGAGIDARYQRLGKPNVGHWYDLDLPEVIAIRRQLLPETEKNTYLSLSLFDEEWIKTVKKHNAPVLIILEGVLMYFDEEQVKTFFNMVCSQLNNTTILLEILAYMLVKHAKQHDAVSKTEHKAEFRWSILNTADMEQWHPHLHLLKEYYMSDYDQGRYPFLFRMLYKVPSFYRRGNQRVAKFCI